MIDNIAQPHDHFLKELLSYPKQAGTLLRERLPHTVVKFLSAKPPRLVDASFVDAELRGHLSDRLFEVETVNGKTVFLYILVEHKSTPDKKVALPGKAYFGAISR
uniref:Transposase, YhgA-like n=1 Tax=Candidatus Kentrum sp. TUN TaxID=2126343 RepID=A0A451ABS0_9GAMM|nr:MAG: Putative transposase, YhgA-like [Candidatus Kentron sp. TUN]VFK72092.1 MAG: Putative transposase, YhgA-like [Candidatus Kentron sp. TUN]